MAQLKTYLKFDKEPLNQIEYFLKGDLQTYVHRRWGLHHHPYVHIYIQVCNGARTRKNRDYFTKLDAMIFFKWACRHVKAAVQVTKEREHYGTSLWCFFANWMLFELYLSYNPILWTVFCPWGINQLFSLEWFPSWFTIINLEHSPCSICCALFIWVRNRLKFVCHFKIYKRHH